MRSYYTIKSINKLEINKTLKKVEIAVKCKETSSELSSKEIAG